MKMGLNVPAKRIEPGQPMQSVLAEMGQNCLLSVKFLHVKAPNCIIFHSLVKTKSRISKVKTCITFMSN